MKSLLITMLMLVLPAVIFAGEITKTYQFSSYTIENKGEFQLVKFDGCLNTGYSGAPAMPWFAVKLLLPPGEEAVSFSLELKGETTINGKYIMYPQQPSRPVSSGTGGMFVKDENVYASVLPYPGNAYGQMSTEYMNGHGVAMLNICPLVYLPSEGKLSYYTEVRVTIRTSPAGDAENALRLVSNSDAILKRISSFVQNPDMIAQYPVRNTRSGDYQLLIITPQQFAGNFDELTGMYLFRGLKSEVASVEDISATMSGQDLQEKIRNYIIQEVQGSGVEFVLLGGDVEHVPYRGFYCYVQSGSGYSDDGIPADLYYSALDGSWNDDNDNRWGEPGEDDLLPDVAVGRYSFSNLTELSAMLNKTIKYQDEPILGEMTNPLLAGEYLYNNPTTWGSDYLRLLIGYHDDNGYTTIGIPPDQDIDSLYERWNNWGGSDIIAKINSGKSFVHHVGHASASTVMHLSISDITNNNFSQVNGITHNFTFVQSHGCICGAFDESDCIMEHMVKINNFAAAVIGNSRYGWFNEGQTEGPAAHLHREMVDAMYEEQIDRIGAAFMESKIQTAPWVTAPGQWEEGALRWNFYDINILGDPTLQLWTDEPRTYDMQYTAPILVGASSMDVTVMDQGTPVENITCALTKDGTLHGVAVTNANGEATITIDPLITTIGTAELTISGYNCLTTSVNIAVSPAGGPFIIYHDYEINDNTGGNGNGQADFGESPLLSVSLANAGTEDAHNVSAILGTEDLYITITDDQATYGTIEAGTAVTATDGFAFDIADYVPDQHVAEFSLDITGESKENWASGFSIIINAPKLEAGTMSIDDAAGGNGNGYLDPGETAILSIGVLNNGHSMASDAEANISTLSNWVSINGSSFSIGDMEPGINYYALFEVTVANDAPLGTAAGFNFSATSGEYSVADEYNAVIGLMVEDWETGDFTKYNWQMEGITPWVITTFEPWEGDYSARSGDIDDSQQSELYITFDVLAEGDIYFYRKVSSETGWDFLRFYIDNNLKGEWSGELDWEMVSFTVPEGLHTFRWVYDKDNYYSNGSDCAWIDFIVFPTVDVSTRIEQPAIDEASVNIWPNPTTGEVNVSLMVPEEGIYQVSLYDLPGHEIARFTEQVLEAGSQEFRFDLGGIRQGIYLLRLTSGNTSFVRKIIVN